MHLKKIPSRPESFKLVTTVVTADGLENNLMSSNVLFEARYNEGRPQNHTKSVLDVKRIHRGAVTVLGKIVTVSEMYVIEVRTVPPETSSEFKDAKFIQLEDTEKLDENERLDVILYDDMTINVVAGEVVEISGKIQIENKKGNDKSKNAKKVVVLHATSIKYINRKELVITPKNILTFDRFASYPKLIQRLLSMLAPNVIGHNDVKLGLLRSIVGGDDHEQRGGGRVNTFMVGDPGTAKSTLANEATKIKPSSRHVSAPHASAKTITAIVDKENESVTLRLGAIPLARNAICAIDEVTAFSPEEQARLLDVLEEGILEIDKHGRHWTIPSPTTIVASANPIQSRWTNRDVISKDEINMLKTLLDRFQQTYVFRDDMSNEQADKFVNQMSTIRKRKPHNYNFLRKYLIYASTIKVKTITPEAEYMINEFWKSAKAQETLTMRMYGGLFSIAEAQAKLHLKDVVDEEIAKQTMESVQLMMIQHGQTVMAKSSPRDITYNKLLEILQNNKAGVVIKSLCEIASKENPQIASYLGKNWSLESNIKVRVIVDMLRNHSDVREVGSKPVILKWVGSTSDNI